MKWRIDERSMTRCFAVVFSAMILASMVMSAGSQELLLTVKQCRSQMRVIKEKIETLSVLNEIPIARAELEKSYIDKCTPVLMQKEPDDEMIENCHHLGDILAYEIFQLTVLQDLLQRDLSSWEATIDFLNETKGCGRF